MNLFIAIAVCFIPLLIGIVIALICIEECKLLHSLIAIILGFLAIFLIILVRTIVNDFIGFITPENINIFWAFIISTIFFAFIEESVKMLFCTLLPRAKITLKAFVINCIIFGASIGCFETVMYLVTGYDTAVRLFTAVIIHIACAVLSGYFIWAVNSKVKFARIFFFSILMHGLYNFFASQNGNFAWISIIIILFALHKARLYYYVVKEKVKTTNIMA